MLPGAAAWLGWGAAETATNTMEMAGSSSHAWAKGPAAVTATYLALYYVLLFSQSFTKLWLFHQAKARQTPSRLSDLSARLSLVRLQSADVAVE